MTDTWTWATVTQASPLRIKVDGDTTALDATTDNLVGSLAVDDRVRVHLHSDGIIVTGVQGGYPTPLVFAWLGAPNASESVLRTVDGTEVRRNLTSDPRMKVASTYVSNGTGTAEHSADGTQLVLTQTTTDEGPAVDLKYALLGGYTYTFSLEGDAGVRGLWTGSWAPISYVVTKVGTRLVVVFTLAADITVRLRIGTGTIGPAGSVTILDKVLVERGDEYAAIGGDYFDGSQYPAQANQVATVEYVQALIAAL